MNSFRLMGTESNLFSYLKYIHADYYPRLSGDRAMALMSRVDCKHRYAVATGWGEEGISRVLLSATLILLYLRLCSIFLKHYL